MNFHRGRVRNWLGASACLLLLSIAAIATPANEITGYYEGDDGGAYFLRQIGEKVYWFGEDPDGRWANIMMGTISGNKINGNFWDVPKGKTKGMGEITLEIQGNGQTLVKSSSTTPFGTKSWKKTVPHQEVVNGLPIIKGIPPELRSRPQGFTDPAQPLTGVWVGDDYATYYVRESAAGDIVWVAENGFWGGPGGYAQPAFSRVFFGKKILQGIVGEFVDLPKGKSNYNGPITMKAVGPQEITVKSNTEGMDATKLWRSLPNSLRGFADLHTHPMVNLGFGGKLVHGGVDVGSLLTVDADCNHNLRAKSISQALGRNNGTHGGSDLINNPCGDDFRRLFQFVFEIMKKTPNMGGQAVGYPSFKDWPKWNDITHQKMWVDWVRRSYDGGQRVMVALAVHNSTLAAIASGPGDGPTDDKASADLQIAEMKKFVARHDDFMEIAYDAADVRRIVAANKMAIILGMEIDHLGNFNKSPVKPIPNALVAAEIKRVYDEGVRYIFPVHVLDNEFGHTAAYEDLFNYSDRRESGVWWNLVCAKQADELNYDFEPLLGDDWPKEAKDFLSGVGRIKLSLDLNAPTSPKCEYGQRNGNEGLTAQGKFAIREMMKLGMLIDIDHMSQVTANDTLSLGEDFKYPLVSGHNNLRSMWPPDKAKSDQPLRQPISGNENSRTEEQLTRIGKLGGMFGLGSDTASADTWAMKYVAASYLVGKGSVSFGSDLNGLVKGPVPESSANIYTSYFTLPRTGDKTWDFRKDGVAHYGMMADFLRHVSLDTKYGTYVAGNIMENAEHFARMWEKAESSSKFVK